MNLVRCVTYVCLCWAFDGSCWYPVWLAIGTCVLQVCCIGLLIGRVWLLLFGYVVVNVCWSCVSAVGTGAVHICISGAECVFGESVCQRVCMVDTCL